MKKNNLDPFEEYVHDTAEKYRYPDAPDVWTDIAHKMEVSRRKPGLGWSLAWTAIVLLLAAGAYLAAAPEARADVYEIIRIGVVNILLGDQRTPPANPDDDVPATESGEFPPALRLEGEMPLEEVRERADFEVKLPSYPPDLGAPDHAYYQEQPGALAVLVWMDETDPRAVRMSLHILTEEASISKTQPRVIETAQVNGNHALWTEGPYYLYMQGLGLQPHRLVEGNVLIWEEDSLTYRLESALPLSQAVRIAESLE